jgi:membrane protease YdiL (CAAX protease family)
MELGLVVFSQAFVPLAIGGAIVLWHWSVGGEMALARRLGQERSLATSFALEAFVFSFLVAGMLAPIVEELLFRGLLYRAWEARWGWFWSMLATSAVFAAYHPVPFAAFIGSIIFVIVLRRTGSIWSPILVHGIGNMFLSPLLLGRFYFNTAGKETGEIALWPYHLAALAVLAAALPVYAWMARDREPVEEEVEATEIRCA